MRLWVPAALAASALLLAGCGQEPGVATTPQPTESAEEDEGLPEGPIGADEKPPVVTVLNGDTRVVLEAWTTCWTNYCADGAPPERPPDVGTASGPIEVAFPLDGWAFQATFRHPSEDCALSMTALLDSQDAQHWTIPAIGPAGAYEVDLFGRGPEGDVSVTFAVTSTTDGEVPAPTAGLNLFFDNDGRTVMYGGASLGITSLAATPKEAAATVTVRAADGRETVLDLSTLLSEGCVVAGSVNLYEPEAAQSAERDVVEEFGPGPYDVVVDVELDGAHHVADLSWPGDVDESPDELGNMSGALELVFDPPLTRATAEDYRALVG